MQETLNDGFAAWLHGFMRRNNIERVVDFARLIEVEPSTVGRWATGTEPSLAYLRKIADRLGVRLGDLMIVAGLATREEVGARLVKTEPDPIEIQEIKELLKRLPERYGRILLRGVAESKRFFLEMYEAPPEPAMRKRERV